MWPSGMRDLGISGASGKIRADLEYRTLHDVMAELPIEMEQLQRSCAAATNAVTARYFAGAEARHWRGGAMSGAH